MIDEGDEERAILLLKLCTWTLLGPFWAGFCAIYAMTLQLRWDGYVRCAMLMRTLDITLLFNLIPSLTILISCLLSLYKKLVVARPSISNIGTDNDETGPFDQKATAQRHCPVLCS